MFSDFDERLVVLLHSLPVGLTSKELKDKVKKVNDVIEEMEAIGIEKSVFIVAINIFSNLEFIK